MNRATIAVLGAGRMGRGIALSFARGGVACVLLDIKPRSDTEFAKLCAEARAEIERACDALVETGAESVAGRNALCDRITFAPRQDAKAALANANILFEAVPETMEAKRSAFAAIADMLQAKTIVASTSSTFLSTDVAALVPQPHRCLNAHWLNPAYVIPLVEVSPHPGTAPEIIERFVAFLERHGKVPVRCAPTAGYIVPRLQTLIMNEAARMVQEGVATPQDIDKAIRVGFGVRYASMGVVEFIDFGGCDILHHASHYLAGTLSRERFAGPEIVARHMQEARLGLKTGNGFYDWTGFDLGSYRRSLLKNLMSHIDQSLRAEQTERPRDVYQNRNHT